MKRKQDMQRRKCGSERDQYSAMRTARDPSPVQLHIELGNDFFLAMLDNFGVSCWNRWIESMATGGYMPLCWGEHDAVPPCWYWLNLTGADLARRNLNRINLGLAYCENCNFDESTLLGSRILFCPACCFRGADLRLADFRDGDISSCDFSDARLDDIRLSGASYDAMCPPLGLPDELLRACKAEPREQTTRTGATEFPVTIVGSLTSLNISP